MKLSQQASFEKAKNAFEIARNAASKLEKSKGGSALSRLALWREFLNNWRICCSSLEHAAGSGKTKRFVDQMKHDIKIDDTLQFIFQSRNLDFHDAEIAVPVASEFNYAKVDQNQYFSTVRGEAGGIWYEGNTYTNADGKTITLPTVVASVLDGVPLSEEPLPAEVDFSPARLDLKNLSSRNVEYPIPMLHVENEQRPYAIAVYGLRFLDRQFELLHEHFD